LRVFDTTFIIDLSNADPGATKLASVVDGEGSVAAVSAITVHEYLLGIHIRYFQEKELLTAKLDAAEKELTAFMILPFTQDVAMESARIQAALTKRGQIIGINDIYIAATAMLHKATIVTRNSSDFEHVQGLPVEEY